MTTDAGHAHGRSCYWDHRRCSWVCPPAPPPAPPSGPARPEQDEQELVAAR